jgi:uncharacterized protein
MLRRLSDRIRFDLDDRYLDKASKIEAYRIKEIVIKLTKHQLVITKGDEIKKLQVDDLRKQPTVVFKEILRLIGVKHFKFSHYYMLQWPVVSLVFIRQ